MTHTNPPQTLRGDGEAGGHLRETCMRLSRKKVASVASTLFLLLCVSIGVNPVRAQTVEYIHTDALGSPVAVTDANRIVIERNEYEPFGKILAPAVPKDGPGYTGHVFDSATELNYMQQRYYDPSIGRFLSVDPVTADGDIGDNFNRYWYANNNPYTFTDPDGRFGCSAASSVARCQANGDAQNSSGAPSPGTKPTPATLDTVVVIGTRPSSTPRPIPWGLIGGLAGDAILTWGPRVSAPLLMFVPAPLGVSECETQGPGACGIMYSKGGKQNVRDTGLIGVSDEEIGRRLRDPGTSGSEKKRLQKEQKARGLRNKSKR